jgi:dCTP deaminase
LKLGNHFTVLKKAPDGAATIIDPSQNPDIEIIASYFGVESEIAEGEKFQLHPGDCFLAYTQETIELPNYLAARIEGRSSLARLGLSIHQTAPTVHATFRGQLRLEISNVGPFVVELKPGIKFCQLILERLGTPSQSSLTSVWQDQHQPPQNH